MILISGCEIFSHLSQSQYTKVIRLIEHSIISTDLAVYFQRRKEFFDVVDMKSYDWSKEKHKSLLRFDFRSPQKLINFDNY